jgi:uncharacterized membrane protein
MGLAEEILGLVIFLGAHVFVTMRDRRAALVAQIGEWPYRGLFSVVSIVGVLLIAYGFANYHAAGMILVWHPPAWTRHIVVILMWPASIMVAAAYIPAISNACSSTRCWSGSKPGRSRIYAPMAISAA